MAGDDEYRKRDVFDSEVVNFRRVASRQLDEIENMGNRTTTENHNVVKDVVQNYRIGGAASRSFDDDETQHQFLDKQGVRVEEIIVQ